MVDLKSITYIKEMCDRLKVRVQAFLTWVEKKLGKEEHND